MSDVHIPNPFPDTPPEESIDRWWKLPESILLVMLTRVQDGDTPLAVLSEEYANAEIHPFSEGGQR